MSIALIIEQVNGEKINREVPISAQAPFIDYWNPVILQENFVWLSLLLSPGFSLTEEDLPEVLNELRKLKQVVPQYYAPDSSAYKQMEERLTNLIGELSTVSKVNG